MLADKNSTSDLYNHNVGVFIKNYRRESWERALSSKNICFI